MRKENTKMQIKPADKYSGLPCSYVGTGCAYEDIYGKPYTEPLQEGLRDDGWFTLENMNKFIRTKFPIKKKQYYKRGERPLLRDFLADNAARCCVCVYGHFIYVNGKDYWSFFNNENDEIVCIWFINESKIVKE